MSDITKAEIEEIVSQAVVKTIEQLTGASLEDKHDVAEFRRDFEYVRAWRQAVQKGTRMGALTALTVLVTGTLGIFVLGIKSWLH